MTEIATAAPTTSSPTSPVRRWTPRRISIAATALASATAAVFVGLAVTAGPGGLGPTAFAVSHLPGDVIAIQVVSTKASADQMTRQLHDQGVNLTIFTEPSTPQLVGTWIGVGATAEVPRAVVDTVAEQTHGYVATIEVPAVFPGQLSLDVGRTPDPGEGIAVGGVPNALAPGGRLFCDELSGAKPAVAAKRLTAEGYTVHWTDGTRGIYTHELSSPPPGSRVSEAVIFDFNPQDTSQLIKDPHDVSVTVIDPHDRRYLPQLWRGFAPSQQTTPSTIDYGNCPG